MFTLYLQYFSEVGRTNCDTDRDVSAISPTSGYPGIAASSGHNRVGINNNNKVVSEKQQSTARLNFWNFNLIVLLLRALGRSRWAPEDLTCQPTRRTPMETAWPPQLLWKEDTREHATQLSEYLKQISKCLRAANDHPVPTANVKAMISATMSLITKQLRAPDIRTIEDTLQVMQTTQNEALKRMQEDLVEIKETAKEAKDAAEKAEETSREIKQRAQTHSNTTTYAAMASKGIPTTVRQNPIPMSTLSTQAQREIVVNIRDPHTVDRLRAMNPRILKAHIDRAIEQSENEHIQNIKIASTNQLKSGDLSIKAITIAETKALKQFAEDWTKGIGNGASARTDTFGIIAHGVRTSTMNMNKPDQIIKDILFDNRVFIPNAEIKYVGWLTRLATTKTMSSIIIEFKTPEDANKIIDEGLIWQGEALQCELYDRQCRLRQCYKCQKYGHIGTQCKATTACGYCAQEHSSQDCPNKADKTNRKCTNCKGTHEAWSRQCEYRKDEIAKIRTSYDTRLRHHLVPANEEQRGRTQAREEWTTVTRKGKVDRPRKTQSGAGESQSKSRSLAKRPREEPAEDSENDALNNANSQPERAVEARIQRPLRTLIPSRRAIEAHASQTQARIHDSQPTDIEIIE
jgi:hypothetical protein